MKREDLIPGIHNYCDRWCERCNFIHRCSLGVIEMKRWAKGGNWDPEDFFREFDKLYPDTEEKVSKWMEQWDFDPADLDDFELPEPDPATQQLEKDLRERNVKYYKAVNTWLKANDEGLKARGIDLFTERERPEGRDGYDRSALAEAIEVILWYQHFMFVKALRAAGGIEDMDDVAIWGSPHQSDANGSAKLAILAAGRSIGAWELVRNHWPEHGETIGGFVLQLARFRRLMERRFPDWGRFIRPGFDTEPSLGGWNEN
jgi:hypothetical protein